MALTATVKNFGSSAYSHYTVLSIPKEQVTAEGFGAVIDVAWGGDLGTAKGYRMVDTGSDVFYALGPDPEGGSDDWPTGATTVTLTTSADVQPTFTMHSDWAASEPCGSSTTTWATDLFPILTLFTTSATTSSLGYNPNNDPATSLVVEEQSGIHRKYKVRRSLTTSQGQIWHFDFFITFFHNHPIAECYWTLNLCDNTTMVEAPLRKSVIRFAKEVWSDVGLSLNHVTSGSGPYAVTYDHDYDTHQNGTMGWARDVWSGTHYMHGGSGGTDWTNLKTGRLWSYLSTTDMDGYWGGDGKIPEVPTNATSLKSGTALRTATTLGTRYPYFGRYSLSGGPESASVKYSMYSVGSGEGGGGTHAGFGVHVGGELFNGNLDIRDLEIGVADCGARPQHFRNNDGTLWDSWVTPNASFELQNLWYHSGTILAENRVNFNKPESLGIKPRADGRKLAKQSHWVGNEIIAWYQLTGNSIAKRWIFDNMSVLNRHVRMGVRPGLIGISGAGSYYGYGHFATEADRSMGRCWNYMSHAVRVDPANRSKYLATAERSSYWLDFAGFNFLPDNGGFCFASMVVDARYLNGNAWGFVTSFNVACCFGLWALNKLFRNYTSNIALADRAKGFALRLAESIVQDQYYVDSGTKKIPYAIAPRSDNGTVLVPALNLDQARAQLTLARVWTEAERTLPTNVNLVYDEEGLQEWSYAAVVIGKDIHPDAAVNSDATDLFGDLVPGGTYAYWQDSCHGAVSDE